MIKKIILHVLFLSIFQSLSFASVPLEQMISQMIIVGFDGVKTDDKWVKKIKLDIEQNRIGGILFSQRNIISKKQTKTLIDNFKKTNTSFPLFFAVDKDGGGFGDDFKEFLYPRNVANFLNLNEAKNMYVDMSRELKALGINLNLSPLASASLDQNKHSFSKYSSITSAYVFAFLDGFWQNKIITCMKYFPTPNPSKKLNFKELKVYFDAIKFKKAKSILSSKAYLKNLDAKYPVFMSKKILHTLLRNELKFDGVIMSDAYMEDIRGFSFKQKIIKSINAGVDILVFDNYIMQKSNIPKLVFDIISWAVEDGDISKSRIRQSYERIKKLKEQIK